MKNKKTLLAAAAVVLVMGLLLGLYLATRPQAAGGQKDITIIIVHKDGTQRTVACTTAEEYLGPVLKAEGLITWEDGPYGTTILSADGETADWNVDQGYWALFEGEEYATTGADGIVLTDGSIYKLVYTIG